MSVCLGVSVSCNITLLASNLWQSCFSFQMAEIIGVNCHALLLPEFLKALLHRQRLLLFTIPKLASRAVISGGLFVQPGSWFLLFCLHTQRPPEPGHRVEPPTQRCTTVLRDLAQSRAKD